MAIEGFDYKEFVNELTSEADEFLPADLNEFQKKYVQDNVIKFALTIGEELDKSSNKSIAQAKFIIQIVAEWIFHKSIDCIKSGIPLECCDTIIKTVNLLVSESAKYLSNKNIDENNVLKSETKLLRGLEEAINGIYKVILDLFYDNKIINKKTLNKALKQSNIMVCLKLKKASKMRLV